MFFLADEIITETTGYGKMPTNAVNPYGVWSSTPMTTRQLQIYQRFPDPVPGTQFVVMESAENVLAWTKGASDMCLRFRACIKEFIEQQSVEQTSQPSPHRDGELDFLKSLHALL